MLPATPTDVINKLREVALPLELGTIPLYLYAMYSIKPEDKQGKEARDKFREIFLQEMLHLALVGNIMVALKAKPGPCLYKKTAMPTYPNDIGYDQTELNLEAANEANLKHFVRIEAPLPVHVRDNPSIWKPKPLPLPLVTLQEALEEAAKAAREASLTLFVESAAPMKLLADSLMQASKAAALIEEHLSIASNYQSIGDVYTELDYMVDSLCDDNFRKDEEHQFKNCFHSRHEAFAITGKATAHQALQKVRDQGEGGGATTAQDSHYNIFRHLLATFRGTPWKLYNVPKNPTTTGYPAGSYIRKLSRAFDAAYCYLLKNIESVWDVDSNIAYLHLLTNIRRIMSDVLTPLANILVLQPFGDGCAAPCFNYYPKGGNPLTLTELHLALQNEIESAIRRVPTEEVISIAAGHALKTPVEAVQFIEPSPDNTTLLVGVTALRASVASINTPSMEHAEDAVDAGKKVIEFAKKNADVAKKGADADEKAADEAVEEAKRATEEAKRAAEEAKKAAEKDKKAAEEAKADPTAEKIRAAAEKALTAEKARATDTTAAENARAAAGNAHAAAGNARATAEKADAAEKAADHIVNGAREASLYLDQKAELREILNRVQKYLKSSFT